MSNDTSLVDLPNGDAIQRALDASRTAPSLALVFHTRNDGRQLSVVTAHRVAADRRQRVNIQPGRPLTHEDEMEVLRLLRPQGSHAGFAVYPSTLLHATAAHAMWWLPPQRYPMLLREAGSDRLVQRTVMWPNLALLVRQRRLYAVAFAGSERPTADTPCYMPPLANFWKSTECCTGTAELPEGHDLSQLDAWARVLRDTAFSHANAEVIRNPKRSGPRQIDPMAHWRTAKPTPFPDNQLVPLRFALRDWLGYTQAVESHR
jgi:PRTRC genetic system protein B